MSLNGIDISSWQTGIDLQTVPADFVIVKATQGTKYVNPDMHRAVRQAAETGKLVGVYHYATGADVAAEACHFVQTVRPYIGRAVLVLDWEAQSNAAFTRSAWAKDWLRQVHTATRIRPLIYMSKSVAQGYDWRDIAGSFGLWVAQYKNYVPTGYQTDPWTDKYGYGAWPYPAIFQYSSSGQLPGWSGRLDLNIAYMDAAGWMAYATGGAAYQVGATYTTAVDLRVRYGPGTSYRAKTHSELTLGGQAADPDKTGVLEAGTRVTCLEVSQQDRDVWIRIPSGWIAAVYRGKIFVQ